METVKLMSSDGRVFVTTPKILIMSPVLNEFKYLAQSGWTVFVEHVDGIILEKLLEWTNRHGLKTSVNELIKEDARFFRNIEGTVISRMHQAAKYLQMQALQKECEEAMRK